MIYRYLTILFLSSLLHGRAVAAEPLPVASAASSPKLISATLSHAELWKRMWLSDFIDDTAQQSRLVDQAKATRGDEKIFSLQEAALYGHINSMVELGQRYAMKGDGVEALRWYVLGFEENWMKRGARHSDVMKILRGELASNGAALGESKQTLETLIIRSLQGKENNAKQQDYTALFKSFKAKTPKGFFDKYQEQKSEAYSELNEKKPLRIFLTEDEQNFRVANFAVRYTCLTLKNSFTSETRLNAFGAISEHCYRKKEYGICAACLIALNTSESLDKLGELYSEGHIGRDENGGINYEKAKEYYEQSKTPNALYKIGFWYYCGRIGKTPDGIPNYEEAAKYYQQSDMPEALCNVSILYSLGHIGRDENGGINYEKAKEYCKKSNTPNAWHTLGVLYESGKIDCHPDGAPNYEEAAKCYQQSKTPKAWHNLGALYYNGYIGRKSNGLPDYENAFLHASQAVAGGCQEAIKLVDFINKIIKEQSNLQLLQQEEIEGGSLPPTSSQSDDEPSSSDVEEEALVDQGIPQQHDSWLAASPSLTPSATQTTSPQKMDQKPHEDITTQRILKKPMTKEERIIRAERRFAQAIVKANRHVASMGLRTSSISDENEKIKPLTIKFINQAVETQYNDWSTTNADGKGVTTLPELIKDIQLKPWGTKGLGQPEVLKEKRYRGCFSRRIGGEQASGLADRFVYKVTGPAEITVLAVGGHYE